MKEMDRITLYWSNRENAQWHHIKNPDIFYTMVTKGEIPVERKEKTWMRPNTERGKEYSSQNQTHRHLYSQIAHSSTLSDPRKSACHAQLPTNVVQARAEVERRGPLPPRTQECPFGTHSCRSKQTKKAPTCILCQNVNRQIADGPRHSYPKVSAYAKALRKRK